MASRKAKIIRKTRETNIEIEINLDKIFPVLISTTIGFLDHMLELFAIHSEISFKIKASGDTYIDDHHLVEDLGIVIGKVLKKALGNKKGIARYGHSLLPMDEVLSYVALDLSGRFYLNYEVCIKFQKTGFNYNLIKDFFYALASNACITVHIKMLKNGDSHHTAESIFKAFGHAFKQAINFRSEKNILSSKGFY
ncbi:MAG: imidazoleglycerol-phosphate dehydratase HisB [Endomicrobium sp.]|jgi:imidazoleglycerol-phosphate dehydratase|nr:imidazoleglycerol-phosphate dehydratase HisB [Endomicrobium sp.]